MDALADLEELQEALSTASAVKADDSPQLSEMAAKFFKGLGAVHLVCNTGQGLCDREHPGRSCRNSLSCDAVDQLSHVLSPQWHVLLLHIHSPSTSILMIA